MSIFEGHHITQPIRETADVCVIGSGAGGAVVAKELAEAGFSVVVLEQGSYFKTEDFHHHALDMMAKMYYERGMLATVGLPGILLPMGITLGGSTTINSGTCFRTPDKVLKHWQWSLGLQNIEPKQMKPYFEKVETTLGIAPIAEEVLGENARLVRKGAEKLGYHSFPLNRNAPGCQGAGHCAFGCIVEAKKGMAVSYLPLASQARAQIYANCRVEQVQPQQGEGFRVKGKFLEPETRTETYTMDVRAKRVIVSCGTIFTPPFLFQNRLTRSRYLGKHLHIHPATKVMSLYEHEIDAIKGVPQAMCIDDYQDEGILMESIFMPPEYTAIAFPWYGVKNKALMADYKKLGGVGIMVSDTSYGRLVNLRMRQPIIWYWLNKTDFAKFLTGLAITAEILFASGAKKLIMPLYELPELNSPKDIPEIFRCRPRRSSLELVAFHPMGTARMGSNPRYSVVNDFGEVWSTRDLFVVDGSIIPTALGVNPQETIMALATRTADYIANQDRR